MVKGSYRHQSANAPEFQLGFTQVLWFNYFIEVGNSLLWM